MRDRRGACETRRRVPRRESLWRAVRVEMLAELGTIYCSRRSGRARQGGTCGRRGRRAGRGKLRLGVGGGLTFVLRGVGGSRSGASWSGARMWSGALAGWALFGGGVGQSRGALAARAFALMSRRPRCSGRGCCTYRVEHSGDICLTQLSGRCSCPFCLRGAPNCWLGRAELAPRVQRQGGGP